MIALKDMVDLYLKDQNTRLSEGSVKRYSTVLKHYVKFMRKRDPDKKLVREYARYMATDRKMTPQGVEFDLDKIKAFYHWAIREELIQESPVPDFAPFISTRKQKEPVTEEEYHRLLVQADNMLASDIWPLAFRCGWHTGLRLSDVANLRWEHVDWKESGLRLSPKKTIRWKRVVEIPLHDEFIEFLRAEWESQQRPETGYISDRLHLRYIGANTSTQLWVDIRNMFDRAEVPGKTFHCFRWAYITRMIAKGVPAEMLSTITGQSVVQLMQYCKPTLKQKRVALGFVEEINKTEHEHTTG